ncbi:uncharacterized protein LOC144341250 [Macaca mulatta]
MARTKFRDWRWAVSPMSDKWCNFYTGITGVNPRYFLTLDSRQVELGFLIKYLCLLCLQVSDEQNQQRFSRQVGCADLLEKNKTKLSLCGTGCLRSKVPPRDQIDWDFLDPRWQLT